MESWLPSIISGAVTVGLIVAATRWLIGAKGAQLPKTRGDASVYGVKRQFQVIGFAAVTLAFVVSVGISHQEHRLDWPTIAIFTALAALGLWIASGSVVTNQTGITKTVFLRSRFFHWTDITEIRLHMKQGGAIELRAGSQKLVIDSRFVPFEHLLNEIRDRTQRPVTIC